MVALYTPIEDLVTENDRRCEDSVGDSTPEYVFKFVLFMLFTQRNRQNRLQRGYVELVKILPWIHDKLASLDSEELEDMLRKVFLNLSLSYFLSIFHLAQAGRGLSSRRRHGNPQRSRSLMGEYRV